MKRVNYNQMSKEDIEKERQKYNQMSKEDIEKEREELKEALRKERARRLWLEAKYNVLREIVGLEREESHKGCIIVPFTNK